MRSGADRARLRSYAALRFSSRSCDMRLLDCGDCTPRRRQNMQAQIKKTVAMLSIAGALVGGTSAYAASTGSSATTTPTTTTATAPSSTTDIPSTGTTTTPSTDTPSTTTAPGS